MSKKDTLIEICNFVYQAAQELASRLTPDERQLTGQPERWSYKDVLSHIALWDKRLTDNLRAIASGSEAHAHPDYEAINSQDFLDHRDDAWEQIEGRLADARESLLSALAALNEDQLDAVGLLPSSQGERPVWRLIAGNSGIHAMMHLDELYLEHGDDPIALQVVEDASTLLMKLDDAPEWQGILLYNQACYHSLVGETEQAIELLGPALELKPDLIELARKDPDLDPIRSDPAFQQIFADLESKA